MKTKIIKELLVSIISAILITFVAFIFEPLFPFNISEGIQGLIFFFIVFFVSFIVYNLLPPDVPTDSSAPNNMKQDN